MMKNYMRKQYQFLVMLLFVSLYTLTACGSKQEITAVKETETVAIEAAVAEEISDEVLETVAAGVSIAETVVEETVIEESAEEIYIPEGIDMESTLPGEEWVASFVGNVAEPVVVIFNDSTRRKEVVQAGSEVIINPDEDRIAVYWPDISMGCTTYAISTKGLIGDGYYDINILDPEKMRTIPERPAKVTVMGGKEDWILEFTIIVE